MISAYSDKSKTSCPKCGEEILLDDCFKDKAVENELKTTTIKCINQDCPWEGLGRYYKVLLYFKSHTWHVCEGMYQSVCEAIDHEIKFAEVKYLRLA